MRRGLQADPVPKRRDQSVSLAVFPIMSQNNDPDPYAELDNRADAADLSEGLRKPMRVRRSGQRHGPPASRDFRIARKP